MYAGALTRELRSLAPGVTVAGLGGPELAAAGAELLADYRGLAVTGLTEAIAKVPRSLRLLQTLVTWARHERPHALVAIDFPDFNFPLARHVRKLGIRVVYYVAPQIWAWRPGRLKTMRSVADRVLVIFPFEEAIYQTGGVPVEFVGHPLVDLAKPSAPRGAFLRGLGLEPQAPTVAILPGSRPNEVSRILPDLSQPRTDPLGRGWRAVRDRAGAAPGRRSLRRGEDARDAGRGWWRETDAVLASADVAHGLRHGDRRRRSMTRPWLSSTVCHR